MGIGDWGLGTYIGTEDGKQYIDFHEVVKTPYDLDAIRKEAYKDGREAGIKDGMCEAWEVARKIVHLQWDGAWAGVDEVEKWFDTYTASEAIEKIRQYEQEQGKIKVGDEVETVSGKAVIIEVFSNGKYVRYMYPDAKTGFNDSCNLTRTGRHFPEIAEVLRKMQEETT